MTKIAVYPFKKDLFINGKKNGDWQNLGIGQVDFEAEPIITEVLEWITEDELFFYKTDYVHRFAKLGGGFEEIIEDDYVDFNKIKVLKAVCFINGFVEKIDTCRIKEVNR